MSLLLVLNYFKFSSEMFKNIKKTIKFSTKMATLVFTATITTAYLLSFAHLLKTQLFFVFLVKSK